MMRFRVRGVTKQDELKIIQVEPVKGSFLLEDEITPGCIQHIISNLMRYGKESKEIRDKMCRILCKVYMDDDSSRKIKLTLSQFIKAFTADNKDAFRRYKGVKILVEMLKNYKSSQVAKTLIHVLNGNGNFMALFTTRF